MDEVQKYTTLTNHGYIGYVVVVNKKFWDGLPGDIRGQLEKAMKEATAFANTTSAQENDEALDAMKKKRPSSSFQPQPSLPPCRMPWSRSIKTWPAASANS